MDRKQETQETTKLFGVRLTIENVELLDNVAKSLNVKRNTLLNIILKNLREKNFKKLEKILEL